MSLQAISFDLQITPGAIPPVLHMSQYDSGRQFTAYLKDETNTAFAPGTGATAKIKGFNAAGVAWEQAATVDGSTVVFTPSGAATDQFGVMPVTIEITYDGETLTPLLVVFDIQRAGYTNEEAVRSPEFQTAIEAAVAAAIEEGGLGFTDDFKEALLACFAHVAWADEEGQTYYDALQAALYPAATLVSITADYEQDRPIYDTDDLDAIKASDDLTVTANYSDGSSVVLGDDAYTLSGTLTAGTSTITVSYGGKTDTIEVLVTESYLPAEYQAVEWVAPDSFSANVITGYIDTGITPTVNTGFEMKLAATSANPERNFFGIRQAQSGADKAMLIQVYSADRQFGFARFGSSVKTASFDNNFHVFVLKPNDVSVDGVAYTLAAPASQTITGQTFRIFGVYVYNASYFWQSGGSQKVQYLKIWENDELVREYVACYRKSDNVIGFYDRVSHTFKTNEGTGSFTKGSDITV